MENSLPAPSPSESDDHDTTERSRRRVVAIVVPVIMLATAALGIRAVQIDDDNEAAAEVAAKPTSVLGNEQRPASTTTSTPELDTVGPTSPKLRITTMAHDELTFTWSPSADMPIPGGVGVAGYDIYVDGELVDRWPADATEAVVTTTERTDGEPHSIIVVPVDLAGNSGTPGWATVKRGPELGVVNSG